MGDAPRDQVDLAREKLRRLVAVVPKHSGWSYQHTVDYKATVREATKLLLSTKATAGKLVACSNKMVSFFENDNAG